MNKIFNEAAKFAYSTAETTVNSFSIGLSMVERKIDGDFVECGVGAGGNFGCVAAGILQKELNTKRMFIGFDSFEGIQMAGKKDTLQAGIGYITHDVNVPSEELLKTTGITAHSKQYVKNNLIEWGIPEGNILLIEGWLQNTLPKVLNDIKKIAILRLDMDIYEPTKLALDLLYPKVSSGGVIILDDYQLDGCRVALEEYLLENKITVPLYSIPNSGPKYFFKP